METLLNTKEKIILRLEANVALANAIRRSVSEISVLAVDEVEIFKNDSALYDEMLAHRIGLVPLKTEKNMNSKTKLDLKLMKKGPGVVYSGDLEGAAEVVYDKIPLTILGENHKIELVATATLGKAIEHAKYLAGLCFYRHIASVKSSPKIDEIVLKSKGLVKPEKKSGRWLCDLNDAETIAVQEEDKNAIENSDEIIFVIESYGNMSARDVLAKAVAALEDNVDEFEKAIK